MLAAEAFGIYVLRHTPDGFSSECDGFLDTFSTAPSFFDRGPIMIAIGKRTVCWLSAFRRRWNPVLSSHVVVLGAIMFTIALSAVAAGGLSHGAETVSRRLYVVTPGIRNLLEYGGAGIVVFDIDHDYRFIKRIATTASRVEKPENIKGVCAHAASRRLYFSTPTKLYAFDLVSEETLWERALPLGCDRMSITPDGRVLYVPSFEKETWNVVNPADGELITTVETNSGAHNTVRGLDGRFMYLAGLKSPWLAVADTSTHKVLRRVGPFSASIRPFTINGAQTIGYMCVNELLGFEIGDLTTGQKIARVEVEGFERGPVARHNCPSHGIGLRPDEREVWLCDAHNRRLHVFDITTSPPRQTISIALRDEPGWITFSLDGRHGYASTGEIIDTDTKRIVTALADDTGLAVHSEKVVEIHWSGEVPVRVGDQFGVGRVVP
jgi:hypothetical protein